MTFFFPYALLAPLLFGLLYFIKRSKKSALSYPSIQTLKKIRPSFRTILRTPILGLLASVFIVTLSISASRPQITKMEETPRETRDLMLVIDISGSMKERDFSSGFRQLDRLQAVKLVVGEFIAARTGDRIGLSVFGTQAFLQSPLTTDHTILIELLNLLQIGIAGEGTAIGDGLGVALKSLKEITAESKAIILLTDGSNNSGQVSPIQAATIAKKLGIKVHTVGIGSKDTANLRGVFGQSSDYDEKTLRQIAETTGGLFFNASDLSRLKEVYREIDQLEKREDEQPNRIIVKEFYPIFAFYALISSLLYLLLSQTIFLKIPS